VFTGDKYWGKFSWDGKDTIKDFEDNDGGKKGYYDKHKSDDKLVFCKEDLDDAVKDKKVDHDWIKDGHLNPKYFTDDKDHPYEKGADHHFVWDRKEGHDTGTLYFDANGEYKGHQYGDLVKLADIHIVGKGDLDATDILVAY
jgi:hypothetical protein